MAAVSAARGEASCRVGSAAICGAVDGGGEVQGYADPVLKCSN